MLENISFVIFVHTVKVIDNSGTDEPTSASITIIVRGRAEYELIINARGI